MILVKNILNAEKISPDKVENNLKKYFDENKIFALISAIIIGILTHLTFITEMLFSQDGLLNSMEQYKPGNWELQLGRWGLILFGYLIDNLSIPNITGIISIIISVFSVVLIVDILELKKKFSIFLTSFIIMASPSFAGTLIYAYTSVAYFIAFFISILTVKMIFMKHHKPIFIICSIICFNFVLSIYQSYIGVVIGLITIKIILNLIKNKTTLKEELFIFLNTIIVAIFGGILYLIISKLILNFLNLELANYDDINNISILNSIKNIFHSVRMCYINFYNYFFTNEIIYNTNFKRQIFYIIYFISIILLEINLIIKNGLLKSKLKLLLIVFLNLFIPISLNCIGLLVINYSAYILTTMQFILVFIFGLALYEDNGYAIFRWFILLTVFIISFTYFLSTLASYTSMKLTYNQAIEVTNRFLTRMELAKDYDPSHSVMISGFLLDDSITFSKRSNIYNFVLNDFFASPVVHGTYDLNITTWMKFINYYIGTRVVYCNTEDAKRIMASDEYKEMPLYPAAGSVKNIGGVMVVKLSNNPPTP